MEGKDRDYIHGIAQKERMIRDLSPGDYVEVEANYGSFSGTVEDIVPAEPGEGNYIIFIDADDSAEPDLRHHVVIDYEGAFASEYDYYVPYVSAGYHYTSLHDVNTMAVTPAAA